MADITWTNVTDHAAELSTVGSAARVDILAYVNDALAPGAFGGSSSNAYKLARIYLAAHLGLTSRPGTSGNQAGPVTSESAGGLSRSYAQLASAASDDSASTTRYGREYLALCRRSTGGPVVL